MEKGKRVKVGEISGKGDADEEKGKGNDQGKGLFGVVCELCGLVTRALAPSKREVAGRDFVVEAYAP